MTHPLSYRLALGALLALSLTACSTARWTPPSNAQGKACVQSCNEIRKVCQSQNTGNLAGCADGFYNAISSYDAAYEYRQPSCGGEAAYAAENGACQQSYKQCFVGCGGQVVAR